jgi:hypothetical protein
MQHASAASTPGTASHHGDLQTDSFFSPVPSAAQVAGSVSSSDPPVGSLASPSIAHKVDVSAPGLVDGMQGGSGGSTAGFVPSYGVGADGMSMSMMSHDGTIREQAGEKTLFPTDTRVVCRPDYSGFSVCRLPSRSSITTSIRRLCHIPPTCRNHTFRCTISSFRPISTRSCTTGPKPNSLLPRRTQHFPPSYTCITRCTSSCQRRRLRREVRGCLDTSVMCIEPSVGWMAGFIA